MFRHLAMPIATPHERILSTIIRLTLKPVRRNTFVRNVAAASPLEQLPAHVASRARPKARPIPAAANSTKRSNFMQIGADGNIAAR
jgi:hypothetical protein